MDCKLPFSRTTNALIIGSGLCGLLTALTLAQRGIECAIFELRDVNAEGTFGGAMHLAPNALRVLQHYGLLGKCQESGTTISSVELHSIQSGKYLGGVTLGSKNAELRGGLCVERRAVHAILVQAVLQAGVDVYYGKELISISESPLNGVTATFGDGTQAMGTILFGCDGIHSAVRKTYVEPARKEVYSGLSAAYGFASINNFPRALHFKNSAINISQHGSILTSFCNPAHTRIFVAAIRSIPYAGSGLQKGWRAQSSAVKALKGNIFSDLETGQLPMLSELVSSVHEIDTQPIYSLPHGYMWHRGSVLLLGDAAHAMEPFGTPSGVVFEDPLILGRIFDKYRDSTIENVFKIFNDNRRNRVESMRKNCQRRKSSLEKLTTWINPIIEPILRMYMLLDKRGTSSEAWDFNAVTAIV